MKYIFALAALVLLHTPDRRDVWVDPDHVTSLHESKEQVTNKAKCVINLDDGRFVTVIEECEYFVNKTLEVRRNEQ